MTTEAAVTTLPASARMGGQPAPVAHVSSPSNGLGLFADAQTFAHAQRVANAFAASGLVPAAYAEKPAACLIALDLASRLDVAPLTVMQNTFVVGGRPGFSVEFLTALTIQRGKFKEPITYTTAGNVADGSLEVTAHTVLSNGVKVSAKVTLAEARADGWAKNAKYNSIPERMLTKRAAGYLIGLYAPDVKLGLPTVEELHDEYYAGTTINNEPVRPEPTVAAQPMGQGAHVIDAEPASPGPIASPAAEYVPQPTQKSNAAPGTTSEPTENAPEYSVISRHGEVKNRYRKAGVAAQKGLQAEIEACETLIELDTILQLSENAALIAAMSEGSQGNITNTANLVRARLSQAPINPPASTTPAADQNLTIPLHNDPNGQPDWERWASNVARAVTERCDSMVKVKAVMDANITNFLRCQDEAEDWAIVVDTAVEDARTKFGG